MTTVESKMMDAINSRTSYADLMEQCAAITQEVAILFARWCQDEDWTPTLESYQHYITHIYKPAEGYIEQKEGTENGNS